MPGNVRWCSGIQSQARGTCRISREEILCRQVSIVADEGARIVVEGTFVTGGDSYLEAREILAAVRERASLVAAGASSSRELT